MLVQAQAPTFAGRALVVPALVAGRAPLLLPAHRQRSRIPASALRTRKHNFVSLRVIDADAVLLQACRCWLMCSLCFVCPERTAFFCRGASSCCPEHCTRHARCAPITRCDRRACASRGAWCALHRSLSHNDESVRAARDRKRTDATLAVRPRLMFCRNRQDNAMSTTRPTPRPTLNRCARTCAMGLPSLWGVGRECTTEMENRIEKRIF